MTCFRNFTAPLWQIFTGDLLLLCCVLFYLAWWVVTFRPGASGGTAGMIYITVAFITGIAAIALLSGGISSLSQDSKGLPIRFVLVGVAVLFVAALLVTTIGFHRIVTSELMIIFVWAALQLSAVVVLHGTGRFGPGRAATLFILIGIATMASLVFYVLYYRLGATAGYQAGMAPLSMAAVVMAVFLAILAVS